jgi:hypothetical protein
MLASLAVFCGVQDRVTAAGARRYVTLKREAGVSGGHVVTIDEIMRPAVARSVREAFIWSGGVLVVGLVAAGIAARRR